MVTFWIEREKRVFGFFSSSSFIYCICGDRMNLIGIISQGTWTHIHVVGQQQGKQSCILLQWTFLIQDVWVRDEETNRTLEYLLFQGQVEKYLPFHWPRQQSILTSTYSTFSPFSLSVVNFSSILDSKKNSSLLSLFS